MLKSIFILGVLSIGLGLALALVFSLQAEGAPPTDVQSSIVVDTLDDEDNADGDCSLREAIHAANDNIPVDACLSGDGVITDTISFNVAGIITVTDQLSVTGGGPLEIDGGDAITVSGDNSVPVMDFLTGTTTILENLMIADGYSAENGGGINNAGSLRITNSILTGNNASGGLYGGGGGGIYNSGKFVASDSILSGNSAGMGGGIFNSGQLTITNSTLSGNRADYEGGGIDNWSGTLVISNSTLEDNLASFPNWQIVGGGIANHGVLKLTGGALSANSADWGGGIYNDGNLEISGSSLTGNSANYYGGGIYNIGGILTVTNTTLSSNTTIGAGGGFYNVAGIVTIFNTTFSSNNGDDGGAISSASGTVDISESILLENSSIARGGGITNSGVLTITNSTLTDNSTTGYEAWEGGGIYNWGTLVIYTSTLTGNTSGYIGGGISNDGVLTVTASTIYTNTAVDGGGIDNSGTLFVQNSTLSGNTAQDAGGGINNSGEALLSDSTLYANGAVFDGGAVYNWGTLTSANSILAGSPDGGNCVGTIADGGYNLEDTDTCALDPTKGSLPNTDPLLGPLQDNGGSTWTHALLDSSPAIDAGDPADCPGTDQRGVPRPIDGDGNGETRCDIGSFEYEPNGGPYLTTTSITADSPDPSRSGEIFTVTFEVTSTFGLPGGSVTVTVESGPESCTGELAGSEGSCALALAIPGNYTLTADYIGDEMHLPSSDSEVHEVINTAPLAEDDSYNTAEDTPLSVAVPGVLGNDSDPDGDSLTTILDSDPLTGTLILSSDGSFIYTPAPDYTGTVTFTYHASDGQVDSNIAMVTITILAANDPPQAEDDAFTVPAGSMDNEFAVLANDSDRDGDPLTVDAVGTPDQGGMAFADGEIIIYTPAPGFSGTESFTYTISDGNGGSATALVSVTVMPVGYRIFLPVVIR